MLHADSFISTMTHDLVQFRDDKAAVLVILHMFMFLPGPICPIDCKQERNITTERPERQKDIVVVLISSMPLLCVLSLVRVIADEEKVIFLGPWGSSKFYLIICIIYVYYIYIYIYIYIDHTVLDQLYIYIHTYIYIYILIYNM